MLDKSRSIEVIRPVIGQLKRMKDLYGQMNKFQ